jgi:hypothetical protein
VGFRNDVGFAAPERLYTLNMNQDTRITVTNCPLPGITYQTDTSFEAYLRLYDNCPKFVENSPQLLAENNPSFYCAYLTYVLRANETYWLMLEGTSGRQSGDYELYLECLDALTARSRTNEQ